MNCLKGKTTKQGGRKVTVTLDSNHYLFTETNPRQWVYVLKPRCTFSSKRNQAIVFNSVGDEGVLDFFHRCARTVEFFKIKKGGSHV